MWVQCKITILADLLDLLVITICTGRSKTVSRLIWAGINKGNCSNWSTAALILDFFASQHIGNFSISLNSFRQRKLLIWLQWIKLVSGQSKLVLQRITTSIVFLKWSIFSNHQFETATIQIINTIRYYHCKFNQGFTEWTKIIETILIHRCPVLVFVLYTMV